MTYGEVLEYFLELNGISKAEIAHRVGISNGQVSDLISGRTKEPTLTRAKAIADALGVTIQDMVDMMESLE